MTNGQKPPRRNPTQPVTLLQTGQSTGKSVTVDLRGVITDEQVARMREQNEQRAREAAERLGNRYVLHRDAVARKPY